MKRIAVLSCTLYVAMACYADLEPLDNMDEYSIEGKGSQLQLPSELAPIDVVNGERNSSSAASSNFVPTIPTIRNPDIPVHSVSQQPDSVSIEVGPVLLTLDRI